jgi:nucleoside-specific outer membrane channel protein Tsx
MQNTFRAKHFVLVTSLAVMVTLLLSAGLSYATSAALTDDTYTDSTKSSKNFWNKQILLNKAKGQTGYIRFDLSSIPAGATGADV